MYIYVYMYMYTCIHVYYIPPRCHDAPPREQAKSPPPCTTRTPPVDRRLPVRALPEVRGVSWRGCVGKLMRASAKCVVGGHGWRVLSTSADDVMM